MTADDLFVHCPDCDRVVLAEAPPCVDGHGDDCPDRVCTECGTALVVPASPGLRQPRSRSRGRPAA